MGKKRKPECDLEVERGLYSSFRTAANAVTQLYSQSVHMQRRSYEAGSRASLALLLLDPLESCAELAQLSSYVCVTGKDDALVDSRTLELLSSVHSGDSPVS
eukprot:scaffold584165_cov55-Prasinocladus_malaysianus.AAC.1